MKIQLKLNKRIFSVDIDEQEDYESNINEAFDKLAEQIQANNETIENIFFEELEVVCSDCGVSLHCEEGDKVFKCSQCDNIRIKVYLTNALDVFDDDNDGYIYGLEEVAEDDGSIDYVEWFKTEEERQKCIKENNFIVVD